jgi:hypothetical protein
MQLGGLKGLSMEKWMCWSALGASGVVLLLFLVDLIMGFASSTGMGLLGMPPGGVAKAVDIFAILACGLVAYVSWDALQDLR